MSNCVHLKGRFLWDTSGRSPMAPPYSSLTSSRSRSCSTFSCFLGVCCSWPTHTHRDQGRVQSVAEARHRVRLRQHGVFRWLHPRGCDQVYIHAQLGSESQRHCEHHGLLFPTFSRRFEQVLSSQCELSFDSLAPAVHWPPYHQLKAC